MPGKLRARRTASALFAVACVLVTACLVLFTGPRRTAMTSDNGPFKPRVYDMPPEQTRQVASALAVSKLGWRIVKSDPASGTIVVAAKARLGFANDEITATVQPNGQNAAVSISSSAQYAGADFGTNAQHIRDLQAAMDQQLPSVH